MQTVRSCTWPLVIITASIALASALIGATPIDARTAPPETKKEALIYSFRGVPDGAFPFAGVYADRTGALYGTTIAGGSGCASSGGCGTVFKVTRSKGRYQTTIIHSFAGSPNDGSAPTGGNLVIDGSGAIYGATSTGGSGPCSASGQGCGVVYKLTPSASGYTETVIHDFQSGDGADPSGLTLDANGNLFGVANQGGSGGCQVSGSVGCGIIFELSQAGSGYHEQVLHTFEGGPEGAYPIARMILDAQGDLFGTTFRGGSGLCSSFGGGCGTVYELARTRKRYSLHVLYNFQGGSDGALPQGGVIADASGTLFGMTVFGGSGHCQGSGDPAGCGVVYKLAPSSSGYVEGIAYNFQGSDGARPLGSLSAGPAGAFYGTTSEGGTGECHFSQIAGCGVVFELVQSGSSYAETVLHKFRVTPKDGSFPANDLAVGQSGVLFGATENGGAGPCGSGSFSGCGTVFDLRP